VLVCTVLHKLCTRLIGMGRSQTRDKRDVLESLARLPCFISAGLFAVNAVIETVMGSGITHTTVWTTVI
jgi:hypothetical protein